MYINCCLVTLLFMNMYVSWSNTNEKRICTKKQKTNKQTEKQKQKHIIDTSIKRQISGQSTYMLKGCMHMFDVVDTPWSYGRVLIVC